jgi:hypothetical protein
MVRAEKGAATMRIHVNSVTLAYCAVGVLVFGFTVLLSLPANWVIAIPSGIAWGCYVAILIDGALRLIASAVRRK